MAWTLVVVLYVLGFIGLDTISRDYSTASRTRETWLGLVFWPFTIAMGVVGDLWDKSSR
jgi:succinate dehydrogenase hydrophobic anchor subunit